MRARFVVTRQQNNIVRTEIGFQEEQCCKGRLKKDALRSIREGAVGQLQGPLKVEVNPSLKRAAKGWPQRIASTIEAAHLRPDGRGARDSNSNLQRRAAPPAHSSHTGKPCSAFAIQGVRPVLASLYERPLHPRLRQAQLTTATLRMFTRRVGT